MLPRPFLAGVVHLAPTPGAPRYDPARDSVEALLARAAEDAASLVRGGCDALVVENFGDVPFFPERVPPETVAALALAVQRVRSVAAGVPVGVNVLRNDARAALGIAAVCGASFVRVNVHTSAAVTDQGLLQGRAAETLRERARLAPGVAIWADVHVKHATPIGRETLAEAVADAVRRGLADAVVVTGVATGRAPAVPALEGLREHCAGAALVLGSGLDATNAAALLAHADGAIVGTSLKRDGRVEEPVDPARVETLARVVRGLREP